MITRVTGNIKSLLGAHGLVDVEKTLSILISKGQPGIVDVEDINKASEQGELLVAENGEMFEGVDKHFENRAKYKIVPTGIYSNDKGLPIYASFIKSNIGWDGCYIETIDKIFELYRNNYRGSLFNIDYKELFTEDNKYTSFRGKGTIEIKEAFKSMGEELDNKKEQKKTGSKEDIKVSNYELVNTKRVRDQRIKSMRDLIDKIYDKLLITENWRATSKNRLGFYIKGILTTIQIKQKSCNETIGNGYTWDKNREKYVFNTGLLDRYGNDIYLIDFTPDEEDVMAKDIGEYLNKSKLVEIGFEFEHIKEMPDVVQFTNNKMDYIFQGEIEDFDLEDDIHIYHIIESRSFRFGDKYNNMSKSILCSNIKQSIRHAVRMSKRDYKYVLPKYNFNTDSIQYLMPIYLDGNFGGEADLVAVVGKENGFWVIFTVLETETAYDNARLISKPESTWLKI